jgi:hypothetical protein
MIQQHCLIFNLVDEDQLEYIQGEAQEYPFQKLKVWSSLILVLWWPIWEQPFSLYNDYNTLWSGAVFTQLDDKGQ